MVIISTINLGSNILSITIIIMYYCWFYFANFNLPFLAFVWCFTFSL